MEDRFIGSYNLLFVEYFIFESSQAFYLKNKLYSILILIII